MPKYINADELQEICIKHRYPSIPIDVFKSQPSADVVEIKHGKWVEAHDTSGHDYERCSECGIYIEEIFFANDYDVNFCPNCGADMRGETDG